MKYWVYINDKVDGPYDGEKLVTLQGFTPDTLLCSEEDASSGKQSWAKASTIFDFEPTEDASAAAATLDNASVNSLLEKLTTLTAEMSTLQQKLDTMESNMESRLQKALEDQRIQLESAFRSRNQSPEPTPETTPAISESADTQLPTQEKDGSAEPSSAAEQILPTDEQISSTKASAEEELVIRSALDSLYNSQLVSQEEEKQDANEDTFQDLLTPKQAEDLAAQVEKIPSQEIPEQLKADLLDELAIGTPKEESVLDQIIKEKQEESNEIKEDESKEAEPAVQETETVEVAQDNQDKPENEQGGSSVAAIAAAGVAAAGVGLEAAMAASGEEEQPVAEAGQEEDDIKIDFSDMQEVTDETPMEIAPDKENPSEVEPVLPAEQMPEDVPQSEDMQPQAEPAQLPEDMPADVVPLATEQPEGENPTIENNLPGLDESNNLSTEAQPPADTNNEVDDNETSLQELVPGAKVVSDEGVLITDQDLKDAFTERKPEEAVDLVAPFGQEEDLKEGEEPSEQQSAAEPTPDFSNQALVETSFQQTPANELTEIELKEGATYLISDFVPPAQVNNWNKQQSPFLAPKTEEKNAGIQDMLSSSAKEESKKSENMDIASALQQQANTTKRGATFDIKTVPMVQDPSQSERIRIDGLNDTLNTQHDIKPAEQKSSGLTKMVISVLFGILLLIVLYVLLAFMNLLPASLNILSKEEAAPTAATQQPTAQMEEMLPQGNEAPLSTTDAILEEVKQYALPNGYTLQAFIEARHPSIAPDLIKWDISSAVEPDNYSVLAKVPPETPQSFKISYRFNYNTVTKALDPTISDAKNLLEAARGSTLPSGL